MPTKSVTLEELAGIIIEEIRKMTRDEKAHLRAKLKRAFSCHSEPTISSPDEFSFH
jgi:hypothetical protein